MKTAKRRMWIVILLISITLTACQVTRENTLDAFSELPFSTATQIVLVVNRGGGSHCDSYIVEAIYFTSQPISEFVLEMEASLLLNGWEISGQDLSTDAKIRYADYSLGELADLSIRPEVNPIYTDISKKSEESIDMSALQLSEGYLLDNANPEDGYFLIWFYYHPYPPNDGCHG